MTKETKYIVVNLGDQIIQTRRNRVANKLTGEPKRLFVTDIKGRTNNAKGPAYVVEELNAPQVTLTEYCPDRNPVMLTTIYNPLIVNEDGSNVSASIPREISSPNDLFTYYYDFPEP